MDAWTKNDSHFTDDVFKLIFSKEIVYDITKFQWYLFLRVIWRTLIIGLGHSLTPVKCVVRLDDCCASGDRDEDEDQAMLEDTSAAGKDGVGNGRDPSDEKKVTTYQWWRHQMETFSALMTLCVGNSPVTGEFPTQRPVTQSFDVSLIRAWINGWVNNREDGDLRRHPAH